MDGVIWRRIVSFSCLLLLCGCQVDQKALKAPSGRTVAVSPPALEPGESSPSYPDSLNPAILDC